MLEKNDELTNTAACYDAICLGDEAEKDLEDIFEDEKDFITFMGNESQLKNLLVRIGVRCLSEILNKHGAGIVLMPDNSIELIRSIDEQLSRGELK